MYTRFFNAHASQTRAIQQLAQTLFPEWHLQVIGTAAVAIKGKIVLADTIELQASETQKRAAQNLINAYAL